MSRDLPQPHRERWQPLRAGLVDLFYYDEEEFWFRDGRLLLRGNNGTGKSKVLALVLPFLLDGDLSPHRVEPDADPKKKMEWNLLLGGAHPYPERIGYAWLEFGTVDADGEPWFVTLGCGMKAVSGRGIAQHWFFVTTQRVGPELDLVDSTGSALTRDRLADALGEHGTRYDRAREYRRAVDEALFGFGEQRYHALVDLLIQLRAPQLSKRPSEKALSAALTEALPPMDQAIIADVADAFRSLEEDREALREMTEAHGASRSFLDHYRRYARIATRRRAAGPREAQGGYERTNRELTAAESEFQRAVEELSSAEAALAELTEEQTRLAERERTLRASPEMRSARELELAANESQRLAGEAERLTADREKATQTLLRREDSHRDATGRHDSAAAALATARRDTVTAADAARIGVDHREQADAAFDGEPVVAELRRVAGRLADRQQRAVDHVRELITADRHATAELATVRRRVEELDEEADELARRRSEAEETVATLGAELLASVRGYLHEVTELRVPDPAAALSELELWVETLDGPNPAGAAVDAARQSAADDLTRADADAAHRGKRLAERGSELTAEIDRLERGEDEYPPVPHTRAPAAREDRSGAPLWRLVDFADSPGEGERAGLEAALEAAGILDAWVSPDGELRAVETDDVLLTAGAPAATGLDTMLRPAVGREDSRASAVSDATVSRVLAAIGFGEQDGTWVAADGRFRIGVLKGAWRKPAARYIGRGAREAARRQLLAERREELSTVDQERAAVDAERERLAERKSTLVSEAAGLPGDHDLRAAHTEVAGLVRDAERHVAKRERAAAAVTAATGTAEAARAARDEGARDADLPADDTELSEVEQSLREYGRLLAGLWPLVDANREAERRVAEASADRDEARSALDDVAERAERAGQDATAAREHHDTLAGTVGAAVAELQHKLEDTTQAQHRNESGRRDADERRQTAREARGKAGGVRDQLSARLDEVTRDRAAAAEVFRRFATTGLLTIALPELDVPDPEEAWAPDPTVRLARRVNDELVDVTADDAAWERVQKRLAEEHKTLSDTLSQHGHRTSLEMREEGVIVEVEFRGKPSTVPELTGALATEVTDRERLLDEREREILENHLLNEVATTLQELISDAEESVSEMNHELERRPTSTGMRLRLLWRPDEDGPAGLEEARKRLLRQTADAWSEEDRSAVGSFLQAQIATERSRNPAGTWLEHLTRALDYRRWSRFVIQRHQNGQWRSATGPASGGERVLAASVPLFAAASAHYASAGKPHAPRLVTLDEAFAGVDDNARAKYLGLLAAFDLDVVMTSEREWGCYPEVPGLGISQLSRTEDVAAVLVTNWEWDGSAKQRVDRPVRSVASEEQQPALTEGLWNV